VSTANKIYKPVTILTEDEYGRIGSEEWPQLTMEMIIARCQVLSERGWEPQEVQVDDAQSLLQTDWWKYSKPELVR